MSIQTKVEACVFTLCTLYASSIFAVELVGDPEFDDKTHGNWGGVYGSCYNVLPQASPRACVPEVEIGPDFEGTNPEQYVNRADPNCKRDITAQPEFSDAVCIKGDAPENFDVRIYTKNGENAFAWGFGDSSIGNEVLPGTAQENACMGDLPEGVHSDEAVYASTFDNDRFVRDPLSGEILIKEGGDARIAYYFLTEKGICRSQKFELFVNNVAVPGSAGEVLDFSSGRYVVFNLKDIPNGALVRLDTQKIDTTPACGGLATGEAVNSHLSGIFVDGTRACARAEAPSRTLGYWKNHPTVINNESGVLDSSLLPLNFCGDTIDEACDAVAYLRSKGGGLGNFKRQGMAALLNCEAFGCPQDIRDLINAGSSACAGGGSFDFGTAGSTLDAFNNENDGVALPFQSPSAQPKYCSSDDDKKGNNGKKDKKSKKAKKAKKAKKNK